MEHENGIKIKIENVIQRKIIEFREHAKSKAKVTIIGPPRCGKSKFIEEIRKINTEDQTLSNLIIEERTFGFNIGDDKKISELIEADAKKDFKKAVKILSKIIKRKITKIFSGYTNPDEGKDEKAIHEDEFVFWLTGTELNANIKPFEWKLEDGKRIQYHLPGLLLKDVKNYETEREKYENVVKSFGIGAGIFAFIPQAITGEAKDIINKLLENFTKLALEIAGTLTTGFLGGVAAYLILSILGKEEKNASMELLKIISEWKDLDEEVKRLIAAKLAVEMGMSTERGREEVFKSLQNLSGLKLDKLEDTLHNVENRIKNLEDSVNSLKKEIVEIKGRINKLQETFPREGTKELRNEYDIGEYLHIPFDRKDKVIITGDVEDRINEILKNVDNNVCVVTGDAGSGKTTLLYILARNLIGNNKRVFAVEELHKFGPLNFLDLENAYAFLDITDPEKAWLLKDLFNAVFDLAKLRHIIISVRTGYVDGDLKRIFDKFHNVEVGYSRETLIKIAEKELRNAKPELNIEDVKEYSAELAEKSEDLPIYIVEAMKYLREGFNPKDISRMPRGIRLLVVNILEEEVRRLNGGGFLLYDMVSSYPGIPEAYLNDIKKILEIRGDPGYFDTLSSSVNADSSSRLYLHSWYRDVIDDVVKFYEGRLDGLGEYGEVRDLLNNIKESLSEFITSLANGRFGSINNYFERIYEKIHTHSYVPEKLKKMLENFHEKYVLGLTNIQDVADLLLLVSLIHFVSVNLHKQSGGSFNMLSENLDYSNMNTNDINLYYAILGFFINSCLSGQSIHTVSDDRPIYYVTVLFLSRLAKNDFMDNVPEQFLEGNNEVKITLEDFYNFGIRSWDDHITRAYISSLAVILEKLDYFRLTTHIDRFMLNYIEGDLIKALDEISMAISEGPNKPDYHSSKGNSLYELGHYDEAIVEYDKAISLNPNEPTYHADKALSLASLGQCDKVINEINIAIELNPSDVEFLAVLEVIKKQCNRETQ